MFLAIVEYQNFFRMKTCRIVNGHSPFLTLDPFFLSNETKMYEWTGIRVGELFVIHDYGLSTFSDIICTQSRFSSETNERDPSTSYFYAEISVDRMFHFMQ